VADDLSREAVAGVARAVGCRHPARLPISAASRKPVSSQVDGAVWDALRREPGTQGFQGEGGLDDIERYDARASGHRNLHVREDVQRPWAAGFLQAVDLWP